MLSHSIHEVSILQGAKNSSFVWYTAYREECDRNIMAKSYMVGGIKKKLSKFVLTFGNSIMQCKLWFDQIAMETEMTLYGY